MAKCGQQVPTSELLYSFTWHLLQIESHPWPSLTFLSLLGPVYKSPVQM